MKVSRRAATEKEPEQLVIEAGCDSLELVAASYSKTINTLKRQLKEAKKSNSELKETAKERASPGLIELIGAIGLIGLIWVIRRNYK